jgi:lipopolysaccharide/colanic/teichoic acid biosynthesis glycosyltransferase
MERLCDVVFSGLALVILSPFAFIIVIILKLTGEGEVFFLQERIGRNGKPFKLYKFATMLKNSPDMGGGTLTMKGDPRILPVGKVLRATKINELPQLLNVLYGDMSVIGPRPLTHQTFSCYPSRTQQVVISVRPGLSGIGSIIFRKEEEILDGSIASIDFYRDVIAPYKGSLEEWFVLNKGISLYILAIIVTIWTVAIPTTDIAWRVFKTLPEPPFELARVLNRPS